MNRCLLILVLCLLVACSPAFPKNVPFEVVNSGNSTVISGDFKLSINSAKDWENFFLRLGKASRVEIPLDESLFSNRTIIAAFSGQKSTGGYSITITNIEEFEDKLRVHLRESKPAEGEETSITPTQPYIIASITKTFKPISFLVD